MPTPLILIPPCHGWSTEKKVWILLTSQYIGSHKKTELLKLSPSIKKFFVIDDFAKRVLSYILAFNWKMDRKQKRWERRQQRTRAANAASSSADGDEAKDIIADSDLTYNNGGNSATQKQNADDSKFARLLSQNEDVLLNFVADINRLYQEKLGRPAPAIYDVCDLWNAKCWKEYNYGKIYASTSQYHSRRYRNSLSS